MKKHRDNKDVLSPYDEPMGVGAEYFKVLALDALQQGWQITYAVKKKVKGRVYVEVVFKQPTESKQKKKKLNK